MKEKKLILKIIMFAINSDKFCSDRKLAATLEQLHHENHINKIVEKRGAEL